MIYLFYGENTFAANQQVNKLIDRYKHSTGSDFGLQRFTHESEPDKVVNAVNSQSMFAESSLVILEHPSRNKELVERLAQNLERVPDSTVLVVYDPGIDARTKWFKTLKKLARLKEFSPKSESQLVAWTLKASKHRGLDMDRKTARLLVDRVGNDQWRLEQELEKLSLLGDASEETIRQLVSPNPNTTVFELLDSLATGNEEAALRHYDNLKSQNIHELEVLAMLGWQLRNLVVIAAGQGKSDQQIAKDHGINPYVIKKSKGLAKRLRLEDLLSAYRQIMQADFDIKTGATADADASLERIILRIGGMAKTG